MNSWGKIVSFVTGLCLIIAAISDSLNIVQFYSVKTPETKETKIENTNTADNINTASFSTVKIKDSTLPYKEIRVDKQIWFARYYYLSFCKDANLYVIKQYRLLSLNRDTIQTIPFKYIHKFIIRTFEHRFSIVYNNELPTETYAYDGDLKLPVLYTTLESLNESNYNINLEYAGFSKLMTALVILAACALISLALNSAFKFHYFGAILFAMIICLSFLRGCNY